MESVPEGHPTHTVSGLFTCMSYGLHNTRSGGDLYIYCHAAQRRSPAQVGSCGSGTAPERQRLIALAHGCLSSDGAITCERYCVYSREGIGTELSVN
eukprot:9020616-Pyramimonas_sp.AAC.1